MILQGLLRGFVRPPCARLQHHAGVRHAWQRSMGSLGKTCTQVVPTKKCFSTLRRAGMSSEELEEEWRRDHIFPCGTFVGMAVQARLLPHYLSCCVLFEVLRWGAMLCNGSACRAFRTR